MFDQYPKMLYRLPAAAETVADEDDINARAGAGLLDLLVVESAEEETTAAQSGWVADRSALIGKWGAKKRGRKPASETSTEVADESQREPDQI